MQDLYKHRDWDIAEHKRIEETNRRQQESIDKLFLAVFGDKDKEKGMKNQIDEMYEIFVKSGWTIKTLIKVLTGMGVSAGSILGIIKLWHLMFK